MDTIRNSRLAALGVPSPASAVALLSKAGWEPWFYLALLGACEWISDVWQPIFGIWLHVLLAVLLLLRAARNPHSLEGQFYLAISIMPLVRILSFTVAPTYFPGGLTGPHHKHVVTTVWYYFAAEIPLLAAAYTAIRVMDIPISALGWVRPRSLRLSGFVLASGVVVGFGEHLIIQPKLPTQPSILLTIGEAVLLIVSTGVVEETLFRGLIQGLASKWLGIIPGILYTTVGWGLLHIGWDSPVDVLYVISIGFVWAWVRYKNESTLDLGIGHGIANVMLFIVLPSVGHYPF